MTQMPSAIIAPILHLNGDRAATLTSGLKLAWTAIGTAIKALHEAAPNARNYYPVDGLFEQARAQYQERLQALEAVRDGLVAEYDAIQAQQQNR